MTSRLPAPPPVPAEARAVMATLSPPSRVELAAELESIRVGLRDLCRGPTCECCGAPYGEPGVWCGCEMPPDDSYEVW